MLAQPASIEPEAFHRSRPQILQNHICLLSNEGAQLRKLRLVPHINGHRQLTHIARLETSRVAFGQFGVPMPRRITALRVLDLNDPRAEFCQHLAGERSSNAGTHLDHGNSFERQLHSVLRKQSFEPTLPYRTAAINPVTVYG